MQTLYVDIYFLINFTVDLLSLHLASLFTRIKASQAGIIISAFLGGVYAVLLVFIPESRLFLFFGTLIYFLLISALIPKGCSASRKAKYVIAFLIMEIFLGGMVYFAYEILEKFIDNSLLEEIKVERSFILFSLVVLLSIGVLKLLLSIFRNNFSETKVTLKVVVFENEYFVDALVDSGNFLTDPMDLAPVMLIKPHFSKKIFPYGAPDVFETENISLRMKNRIRIIPISSVGGRKVLCGFKADAVFVIKNDGACEEINLTIAFDREEGSFAGFDALIPYAALENVK